MSITTNYKGLLVCLDPLQTLIGPVHRMTRQRLFVLVALADGPKTRSQLQTLAVDAPDRGAARLRHRPPLGQVVRFLCKRGVIRRVHGSRPERYEVIDRVHEVFAKYGKGR